jgi:hypothetical protein
MNIDLVDLLVVEKIPDEPVKQVGKKSTPSPSAQRNTKAQAAPNGGQPKKNK